MTLEEYIEKNFSEKKLNEYSYSYGWHETILKIVRETWKAAQQSVKADGANCPACQAKSVIVGNQCLVCGVFSQRH